MTGSCPSGGIPLTAGTGGDTPIYSPSTHTQSIAESDDWNTSPQQYSGGRYRLWQFLNNDQNAPRTLGRLSKIYHVFIVCLILALFLADYRDATEKQQEFFTSLEWAAVGIFGLEYTLRIYCCTERSENSRSRNHCTTRIRHILSAPMLLDLLSLVALIMDVLDDFLISQWRGLTSVRFVRLLNIMRVERSFKFAQPIFNVMYSKRQELGATLGLAFFLLLITSATMYYVEFRDNPQFSNLPTSMWWATTALTTVGYGDIYPITTAGRILGGFVAFMGVGCFALPAGVIAAGFQEQWKKDDDQDVHVRYWRKGMEKRIDDLQVQVAIMLRNQERILELLEVKKPGQSFVTGG